MSLINCSECKKEISDKATNCPNCGNPINENKTLIQMDTAPEKRRGLKVQALWLNGIFIISFFIFLMNLIAGNSEIAFFFFIVTFGTFIGGIINSIQYWLAKP